jgi:acyl dehydratase
MNNLEWYAAKTIYKHYHVEDGTPKIVFEERIVLFYAADFDEAIAKAEAEASEYCGKNNGTVYLDFVDVFHLFDETIGHGIEVYSLMRESDLSEKDYLDHFYDNGKEYRQISDNRA